MTGSTELSELAPAKINLTLRIGRKRPDGYHDLESLVVFSQAGDALRLAAGPSLGLDVEGPTATQAGLTADNLVLKATQALRAQIADLRVGHFHLTKTIPVAAGLGGGSSDAAAALRMLARLNNLPKQDSRVMTAARASGADVPVCLDPRPRIMRGIGDVLTGPVRLPPLHAVMVNPGVPVPTGTVFAALAKSRIDQPPPSIDNDPASQCVETRGEPSFAVLMDALASSANDLEAPALALFPAVAETLSALRGIASCRLARMSGSGGTCFGLFAAASEARDAATQLKHANPTWWVCPTILGSANATAADVPSPLEGEGV